MLGERRADGDRADGEDPAVQVEELADDLVRGGHEELRLEGTAKTPDVGRTGCVELWAQGDGVPSAVTGFGTPSGGAPGGARCGIRRSRSHRAQGGALGNFLRPASATQPERFGENASIAGSRRRSATPSHRAQRAPRGVLDAAVAERHPDGLRCLDPGGAEHPEPDARPTSGAARARAAARMPAGANAITGQYQGQSAPLSQWTNREHRERGGVAEGHHHDDGPRANHA